MGLSIVTPAIEPMALDDAKAFLNVTYANDDQLIRGLISAARSYAERYLNKQLMPATYCLSLDFFPLMGSVSNAIAWPYYGVGAYQQAGYGQGLITPDYGTLRPGRYEAMTLPNQGNVGLPKPPLLSVTSITYVDPNGVLQAWAGSNYSVVTSQHPGYIKPKASGFPAVLPNSPEAVKITFTAGYANRESIPADIIIAMKLLIGTWYNARSASEIGEALKQSVEALLEPHRFWGF